jgi:alkyl sulfatase BDS1-like metallo-beta-lactamase superfamily hydrolase
MAGLAAMSSLSAPDIVRALPASKFFEAMTVRLDPSRTADVHMTVAFRFKDTGQTYALEIRRGVAQLHESMPGQADASLTMTVADLNRIIFRQTTFLDALKSGEIIAEGKRAEFPRFFGYFDPPAAEAPALTAR